MADILEQISNIVRDAAAEITPADVLFGVLGLAGIVFFVIWLATTSFGRSALINSPIRRNNLPAYAVFIPISFWLALLTVSKAIEEWFLGGYSSAFQVFFQNLFAFIGVVIAAAVSLALAWSCFARRLKGFGLDRRTIVADFGAGFVNLLSVWPIITLILYLILVIGRVIGGEGFHIQRHAGLEVLSRYPQWYFRILMIGFAIIAAPIFEEMLFRGILQSTLRGFSMGPWKSIFLTSAVFATIHPYWMHWPSLFVLSVCFGYAYEKSGSLLRPIFIHLLFNTVSVASVLLQ